MILKKLDIFILKKFLQMFVGAFFVCLFVFMMQFTWRYVDELIGKGLTLDLLAKFFWYMAITLVPQALPLGVLLASLITFGNMGESLELLSMKAAGVPLKRIMRPVGVVAVMLVGISFYFQNVASPYAQVSLNALLFSMKQSSPAVEIPEGVFYSGVPNVNLYVQKKDAKSGMLYQLIIYKTDQGFDRAQIVLADSGRMEMSKDKMHLTLDLWNGEQFENLQANNFSALNSSGVPYDRETFDYKHLIIDFDSNFNLMDTDMLRGMASAKNMKQIASSVDTMQMQMDTIGKTTYAEIQRFFTHKTDLKVKGGNWDSICENLMPDKFVSARNFARSSVQQQLYDYEWRSQVSQGYMYDIRRHWIEWHQKMTFSLACLFFFLIGAPLGAIIRKGGLGMPTVISVIIFILYYIINTSGMKMGRSGNIPVWIGMWASTIILAPAGIWLTYKSNKDSIMFNLDSYLEFITNFYKKTCKKLPRLKRRSKTSGEENSLS